jgi:hypothetical protein
MHLWFVLCASWLFFVHVVHANEASLVTNLAFLPSASTRYCMSYVPRRWWTSAREWFRPLWLYLYDRMVFDVPTGINGDCYDRYFQRPILSDSPKYVLFIVRDSITVPFLVYLGGGGPLRGDDVGRCAYSYMIVYFLTFQLYNISIHRILYWLMYLGSGGPLGGDDVGPPVPVLALLVVGRGVPGDELPGISTSMTLLSSYIHTSVPYYFAVPITRFLCSLCYKCYLLHGQWVGLTKSFISDSYRLTAKGWSAEGPFAEYLTKLFKK